MSQSFKYEEELRQIRNCPPNFFASGSRRAFRLVFAEENNPASFLPPAAIEPKRGWATEPKHCAGFALSLFITGESLAKFMLNLEKSFGNMRKRMGDQIAIGAVTDSDGLIDEPNGDGHFNLHEYSTCDLSAKFTRFASLPLKQ